MNAEFIAIGVHDDGGAAFGEVEGFDGEGDVVSFKMGDSLVEVVHFECEMGAVTGRFQEWLLSYGEGVRADFIFDPESVGKIEGFCAGESEHALIEGAGMGKVCGGINDEGKFADFDGDFICGVSIAERFKPRFVCDLRQLNPWNDKPFVRLEL